jgi:Cu(I)/Ag(I) efflux system membrane fusion protein
MPTPSRLRSPWSAAIAGLVLGILAVLLTPASALFVRPVAESGPPAVAGVRWVCPMLDFVGDHPGRCPICGMVLQRVAAGDFNLEQMRRMGLAVAPVERGPAVVTIRGYGTAAYDERAAHAVIARAAGRVVKRYPATLHEGEQVMVGDPLIDLYSPELLTAQAELQAAAKLGDRQSVAALQARFARLNLAALAERVLAGAAPADTVTIASPYAGHVHRMMGEDGKPGRDLPQVGEEIAADQPLVLLLDHDALMVKIHIPEVFSRFLRVGLPASLASDDLGELPGIDARLDWVAPELNAEIRAREVHLHLRDPAHRLLAGALVQARIHAALGPDLEAADPAVPAGVGSFTLVPKSAVLSTGVRNVAWKQVAAATASTPAKFALAPLALGPRLEDEHGDDRYVVRAGLEPGDLVATRAAFLIDSQAQLVGAPSLLFPDGAPAADPHAGHR